MRLGSPLSIIAYMQSMSERFITSPGTRFRTSPGPESSQSFITYCLGLCWVENFRVLLGWFYFLFIGLVWSPQRL